MTIYRESPLNSSDEAYAADRLDELDGWNDAALADELDPSGRAFQQLVFDVVWDGMSAGEQVDFCDGIDLLGVDFAAATINDGVDGEFNQDFLVENSILKEPW